MTYTYKGKIHDAAPEPGRAPAAPKPLEASKDRCGTLAGYKWHLRHDDGPACDRCKAANAAYAAAYRAATKTPAAPRPVGVFNPSACGTYNGYERHRRRSATPCGPCRAAHTEYHRAYRAAQAEQRAA